MKEIDRRAIEETGFGDLVLMENAGIRILEAAESLLEPDQRRPAVCIAGGGNNGGDALVIARQIFSRRNNPVSIIVTAMKGSPAFDFHLNLCRNLGIDIFLFPEDGIRAVIASAAFIFDGISGTGIRGPLRETQASLVELINDSDAARIAVDVPSGVGDEFRQGYPAVRADLTLTVGMPKRCLYLPDARGFCGDIHTVAIGFPEDIKKDQSLETDGIVCELAGDNDIAALMPEPGVDAYKNSRGHLAVFAGSRGTSGAAVLCAGAASKTAAGLVTLYIDEDIFQAAASQLGSVIVKPIPGVAAEDNLPVIPGFSASAVGPGWGTASARKPLLLRLISESRGVIDADGLNLLAEIIRESRNMPDLGGKWLLTPHPGEFRRLFPDLDYKADPFTAVKKAAERLNCVIMLKGHVSYIGDADGRVKVIDGCFPRLGTGGSGDVLTGLTGGYSAAGLPPFEAAVLGGLLHLRAGKRCGSSRDWFSADELADFI